MKIIFSLEHYLPAKKGGKQTYVQTLGQELLKNGHRAAICTLGDARRNHSEEKSDFPLYEIEGLFQKMPFLFKYKGLKSHPPIYDRLVSKSFEKIVQREKPAIVHCHDWMLYSILPLRKRFGIPIVLTLHDYGFICVKGILTKSDYMCRNPLTMDCISCGRDVFGIAKSTAIFCALKRNRTRLQDVARYIAISDFQREVYRRSLDISSKDIVVIRNSVDLEFFKKKNILNEEKEKIHRKKIALVGRLSWDRMNVILSVLNAAPQIEKAYPHTDILVAGWSEGGGYLKLVNEVARRTNEVLTQTRVQIMVSPCQEKLLKIYGSADIVIGAGRVALEAMACARPVVVAGDTLGPFGGNFGGPVTPDNLVSQRTHNFTGRNSAEKTTSDKIAETCIKLFDDQLHCEQLGSFGRKYVEREHNIEETTKEMIRLYEELLN